MKVLLLVLVLGLALSDASPILRQLRRLIHAKRQEAACVSAANNLGQLLDSIEMWDPLQHIPGSDMSMDDMLEAVIPIDIFNGTQIQDLLCSLDALSTVSELVSVLDDMGVIQNDVRVIYAGMIASMRTSKMEEDQWIQDPPEWMSEEDLEGMNLGSLLITDLESSMFSSYEPELVATMMKLLSYGRTSMDDYVVPAPSTQPLDQQCNVISYDVRKLFNHEVKRMAQWDPTYGERLREGIHDWTGLSFGQQGQMRQLICNLLEIGVNGGPEGLYEFLMSEGIIDRVANKGYPFLQEAIASARQQLEFMASMQPPADHSYDNQYYGGGPNPQLIELFSIVKDFMDNLEAMGLFSLS